MHSFWSGETLEPMIQHGPKPLTLTCPNPAMSLFPLGQYKKSIAREIVTLAETEVLPLMELSIAVLIWAFYEITFQETIRNLWSKRTPQSKSGNVPKMAR